jgi:CPA1 family monovalent cation:H+ antiporter
MLPPILHWLELPPQPEIQAQEDAVRLAAAEAAIRAIEAMQHELARGRPDADIYADAAGRVMELYRHRIDGQALDEESAAQRRRSEEIERKLRIAGLRAERNAITAATRAGDLSEDALRRLTREIDLLEARYST